MLTDFFAAIREGRPAPVTGEDGLAAMAVALATYRSAAQERPHTVER